MGDDEYIDKFHKYLDKPYLLIESGRGDLELEQLLNHLERIWRRRIESFGKL